ncbi:MAG: hypothetical protein OEY25_03125 [Candidatus Aminicenantes bacterium]|nr:hypothetical protein [Candidatus Aminicenantes bacterium]MDH5706068.1 hypothetical protein [Candidatus Aminicenantes bacterium]
MKIFINFGKGFMTTGKTTKMVLFLFVINLLFSLILAVPMYNSLKNSLGASEAGNRMVESFDYIWWEEFRDEAQGLETTFTPSIIGKGAILTNLESLIQMRFFSAPPILIGFGLLYIILHTFLAGGILSTFNQDEPRFAVKEFLQGAGSHFLRFLALMLFSWLFLFAIGAFLHNAILPIIDDISSDSYSEVIPFLLMLALNVIAFFLLLFVQMVFDYARIKAVLEDENNVLKATGKAFRFVFKHPFSTLGLFYLIFFLNIAVTVIYILVKETIPQSDVLTVLAAFFLQQLFIFALIWIRCLLYASQWELYRYLK